MMNEKLELAMIELYSGRCNVALKAKEIDVPLEELKRLFNEYVSQRPIDVRDPDLWSGDHELAWPWV
tara:strand:- start:484 stop:684 length:201 start_codon:yes stop_codon:yes gene_type:complete